MPNSSYLVFDDQLAASVRKAIDATFKTAFQIETSAEAWRVDRAAPVLREAQHAAHIPIRQDNAPIGMFVVAVDREILKTIINAPEITDQAALEDAVAEITNMLYGVFKTSVNGQGYKLSMGLPVPFLLTDEARAEYESAEKFHQPFVANGQNCWVAVAQNRF